MVLSVVFMAYCTPLLFCFSFPEELYILVVPLVVGFCTKSAIFPFSSWLPAAIAAPTPISALVHSSTLVTAGLYLIIRFSPLLLTHPQVSCTIVVIRVFTSLYSGLGALVEIDIKKLVALSTLSHLGFIGLSIFSGAVNLAFLHLISHALFKSLLFMAVGEMILLSGHSQDSRLISPGLTSSLAPSLYLNFSAVRLLGLPFARGFYSKDLVLESMGYSGLSFLVYFSVYAGLLLTYAYTFKLLQSGCSYFLSSPFKVVAGRGSAGGVAISGLGVVSLIGVSGLLWVTPMGFRFLAPQFLKYSPLVAMLLVLFIKVLLGGRGVGNTRLYWVSLSSLLGGILGLTPALSQVSS